MFEVPFASRIGMLWHDESEESHNRGNFLELLKWLAGNNEEVNKVVLKML